MPRKKPPKLTPKKEPRSESGEWKPAFIRALANSANVRAACQSAGISRQAAYLRKRTDEAFAEQWDDALEDACDVLEGIARQRAAAESDVLLIFLLKAHRPEKYRDNHKIDLNVKGAMTQVTEVVVRNRAEAEALMNQQEAELESRQ